MARLEWGASGSRRYETGIDRGVLYVDNQAGVPWVGLSSVEESPSGGEAKAYYIDGVKYLNVSAAEEYEATINAFTYPELFAQCDGTAQVRTGLFFTQQRRKSFGFSYRTKVGNELDPEFGYKIHIVYNALAAPSQRNYASIGDSSETADLSWSITTRPPAVAGYKRTSHIVVDSRTTDTDVLQAIEEALYGNDEESAHLLTIPELVKLYDDFYHFVVTDNGDGTYTVSGPDDAILAIDTEYLEITWPTVVQVDEESYTISTG